MKIEPGMLVSLWESHEERAKKAGLVIVGSIEEVGGYEFPAGTLAIIVERRWPYGGKNGPDEWVVLVGTDKGWVYGRDCKSPGYRPRSRKHDTL